MPDDRPLFLGTDINERLWPIEIEGDGHAAVFIERNGGKEMVEGKVFVRPEDGVLVFRQVAE